MLENLKKEMEKKGIKNKDIAKILGIKSPAVSKRLYGSVKLRDDEKDKIATLLEIKDQEYLFKDTGYTPSKKENTETIFSKRFSELLERDKRTQKEIAEALGVSERTIIDWKQGKQSTNVEMLKKISIELDASFAYLIGESSYCYPSNVNYLDDSFNEYKKQNDDLAIAVKTYLKYLGYNVEVLDRIILEDPILDSWGFFNRFYQEHLKEYNQLHKIEKEFEIYVEKFYKKFGIIKNYDEDEESTAEEIEVSKKLSKDKCFRSLCDQMDELNAEINNENEKYRNKKEYQAKKVKDFFDKLPEIILKEFRSELSDIIDEYNIFDSKGQKLEDCYLSIASLKKFIFEAETLKNDISKIGDIELIIYKNDITGELMLKHKFSDALYQYSGSLSDKRSVIAYLDSRIKRFSESIKKWEKYIENIKKET